jgi:cytochrome c
VGARDLGRKAGGGNSLSLLLKTVGMFTALSLACIGSAWADGDAAKGEAFAKGRCGVCHSTDKGGPNKIGPNLFGVFGRRAASAADYTYSGAMKNSGIVWTADKLTLFLHSPRAVVPGTKMTFAGIVRDEDNANTVAWLATLK